MTTDYSRLRYLDGGGLEAELDGPPFTEKHDFTHLYDYSGDGPYDVVGNPYVFGVKDLDSIEFKQIVSDSLEAFLLNPERLCLHAWDGHGVNSTLAANELLNAEKTFAMPVINGVMVTTGERHYKNAVPPPVVHAFMDIFAKTDPMRYVMGENRNAYSGDLACVLVYMAIQNLDLRYLLSRHNSGSAHVADRLKHVISLSESPVDIWNIKDLYAEICSLLEGYPAFEFSKEVFHDVLELFADYEVNVDIIASHLQGIKITWQSQVVFQSLERYLKGVLNRKQIVDLEREGAFREMNGLSTAVILTAYRSYVSMNNVITWEPEPTFGEWKGRLKY